MNNKIKKYRFIFFLCFAFLNIVACSSDDGNPEEAKPEARTLKTMLIRLILQPKEVQPALLLQQM
ncbi:hypothetical protein [Flavobacterium aestuarii]|uniref:hypothetical protein n=1 Tax=Flavobacterium aestuarii TaxID=3149227 RepID=UPI0032B4A779